MSLSNSHNSEQINRYVDVLQEFLATGGQRRAQLIEIVDSTRALLAGCSDSGQDSIVVLLSDIGGLLGRHVETGSELNRSDIDLLQMTCDWLLQLLALRKEGLPEPQALLGEVRHLFKLSAASCEVSALPNGVCSDPFADDFSFDENVGKPFADDPFSDDPGLSSGLDRLQQTITHVKSAVSLRRQMHDPFALDPVAMTEAESHFFPQPNKELSNEGVDIFSEDPDWEID